MCSNFKGHTLPFFVGVSIKKSRRKFISLNIHQFIQSMYWVKVFLEFGQSFSAKNTSTHLVSLDSTAATVLAAPFKDTKQVQLLPTLIVFWVDFWLEIDQFQERRSQTRNLFLPSHRLLFRLWLEIDADESNDVCDARNEVRSTLVVSVEDFAEGEDKTRTGRLISPRKKS
jgi:hypothetical protein